MLRGLIKTGSAWALDRTNGHRWLASMKGWAKVPAVLGYHRVVEEFPRDPAKAIPAMCITRQMLERHLDWAGRHYRFITLDPGRADAMGRQV